MVPPSAGRTAIWRLAIPLRVQSGDTAPTVRATALPHTNTTTSPSGESVGCPLEGFVARCEDDRAGPLTVITFELPLLTYLA